MFQFIRFLRRTEGVEAARKYFLDVRKSPHCTYHVYVAYAMMAFCLDKDPKVVHALSHKSSLCHTVIRKLSVLQVYGFMIFLFDRNCPTISWSNFLNH